ncbi:MAG: response regulator [Chloroflexi bacterium]|nr:response regulator [Chloroflexota bacterium]
MSTRILVVEDSRTEAMRARLILERAGYQVLLAADGKDGLTKAVAEKPDVILLDALMPQMSGFEACGKLKIDPQTSHIPVILLVSNGEATDLPSGPGLECLLAKPYDPALLVTKVQTFATRGVASPENQDALTRARREIQNAQQARSDFLANMSHELRTPLHEIIGMTELVIATDLTAEQHQYINTARAASNALLSLINDVIEFSELEAGQLGLEERPFDLSEPIERALEIMRARAGDKGLELALTRGAQVPKQLIGDANRLRQVLANLVANAIKFTDAGKISIRVDAEPVNAHQVELHFRVSDTGIGIPQDRQELIFEPFQQSDSSATRRYGGLGVGLALAKQLVRLLGGRIWVASQPGEGSVFHFTVKMQMPAQVAPVIAPVAGKTWPRALRILVAEDSPTNQLIAKSSLSKAGHAITLAANGVQAVKQFQAAHENAQPFDLVLMDVAMPEMDGLDATRAIREKEKSLGGHLPIVAMTAFATKEYQSKCIEAGMDAYVTKPVRIEELNKTLEPLMMREPAATESPVNLRDALEVVGDDVDILRDAVASSLSEVPEQLQQLKEAMTKQDASGVEAKAHRLKGVMGNLGGSQACAVGQCLETMGEQRNLSGGGELVTRFESEIARVVAFYSSPTWEQSARALIGG